MAKGITVIDTTPFSRKLQAIATDGCCLSGILRSKNIQRRSHRRLKIVYVVMTSSPETEQNFTSCEMFALSRDGITVIHIRHRLNCRGGEAYTRIQVCTFPFDEQGSYQNARFLK